MAGVNVIDAGSANRTMTQLRARDAGNVDRVIEEGRIIGPDGADRVFYVQFSVTADSTGTSAGFNSGSAATLTTRPVTVLVTGAVGTATFAWSQVSGDAITIDSPSSASTTFSALVNPGQTLNGVFKCTVTDSSGHSGSTPNIDVRIANHYGGTL